MTGHPLEDLPELRGGLVGPPREAQGVGEVDANLDIIGPQPGGFAEVLELRPRSPSISRGRCRSAPWR